MDARTQEFVEYVQGGGQVETGDWMPDEYRAKLIKFIEMHGNSELMGVLPEREWILRAPTLQRKLVEEVLLRLHVRVERRLLDAHRNRQILHRRAVVALLGEEPGRLPRQLVSASRHVRYPTDR